MRKIVSNKNYVANYEYETIKDINLRYLFVELNFPVNLHNINSNFNISPRDYHYSLNLLSLHKATLSFTCHVAPLFNDIIREQIIANFKTDK